MKRSRLQLSDSESKSNIDRSDRYLSILGNFHISEDPLINDYIQDKLSSLAQCYLLQLINPFLFLDNPIQAIGYFSRSSNLYTSRFSGTFKTSAQTSVAGYGYVTVIPQYLPFNSHVSVYGTTTASTSRAVLSTHTGVSSQYTDSTYASTDLSNNGRRYRICAIGLRIKNVSQRGYIGGSAIALRTTYNTSGTGLTYEDLVKFDNTEIEDFDEEWHYTFWTPKDESDFTYYSGATAIAAEASLQIHVRGPSTTVPSIIDAEVVCIYETTGYLEKGTKCYARSYSELFDVLSLLQSSCHFKGSHTNYKYPIVL